jgi:hypothetical protein
MNARFLFVGIVLELAGCVTPAPSATPAQVAPVESPTPGPAEVQTYLEGLGWDCSGHLTVWDASGEVVVEQDMHTGEEYVFARIATPGDYRYRATANGCCGCDSLRPLACPTGSSPRSQGCKQSPHEGSFRLPPPEGAEGMMMRWVLVFVECDAICEPDPTPTSTGSPTPTGTPTLAPTARPTATPAFWPTGMPRPTQLPRALPFAPPTDEASCQQAGGQWAFQDEFRVIWACNYIPATDTGQPCSDSGECQGWCEANLDYWEASALLDKQPPGTPILMTGGCSSVRGVHRAMSYVELVNGELTPRHGIGP